jgi:hypothetical protein
MKISLVLGGIYSECKCKSLFVTYTEHISSISAPELGIYGAYANDLSEPEVVLTTALACAAHVIFTTADGKDICIVHASDSVGILITVQDLT